MTVTEIKALIHDIADTSSTTFSDARMLRGMNRAQSEIVNAILEKDNFDQYDDPNWGDLNEGYLNIVSGQNSYDFSKDENFSDVLFISKIWILQSATSTTYEEVGKQGKDFSVATGVPCKYRISGKRIIFDITFNYSATNGILIQFIRMPKAITSDDTIKVIGIPVSFHPLLALLTAYYFASAKTLENTDRIYRDVLKEQNKLGIAVAKQNNNLNLAFEAEEINAV